MPRITELEKLHRDLHSAIPIFGATKRRKAVETLEARRNDPECLPALLEAAAGKDPGVAQRARTALETLEDRKAKDALCAMAVQDAGGLAAQIAVARGYRPSDHERDCLFLFLTRQLDLYFQDSEYGREAQRRPAQGPDRAALGSGDDDDAGVDCGMLADGKRKHAEEHAAVVQ